jgi:hypothetical protein
MAFDFSGHVDLRNVAVDSSVLVIAFVDDRRAEGSPIWESVLVSVSSSRIRTAMSSGTLKGLFVASSGKAAMLIRPTTKLNVAAARGNPNLFTYLSMSDSPFTRLQNLTRKPVVAFRRCVSLTPKVARRKFSWPSVSVSFRTSAGLRFLPAPIQLFPFVLDETAAVVSITLL